MTNSGGVSSVFGSVFQDVSNPCVFKHYYHHHQVNYVSSWLLGNLTHSFTVIGVL